MRAQRHVAGRERGQDRGREAAAGSSALLPGRPSVMLPRQALALQRLAGNAAVARALQDEREREALAPSGDAAHGPAAETAVQRSTVHEVLAGAGRPLDAGTRADMEARLGADFSDVRLHTGSAARRSADEIGARGSLRKTSRAAARIIASLRRAWA